jgi:hypothetical protein
MESPADSSVIGEGVNWANASSVFPVAPEVTFNTNPWPEVGFRSKLAVVLFTILNHSEPREESVAKSSLKTWALTGWERIPKNRVDKRRQEEVSFVCLVYIIRVWLQLF